MGKTCFPSDSGVVKAFVFQQGNLAEAFQCKMIRECLKDDP